MSIWEAESGKIPSGATRAEGILHLVHSDVFGPVSVPSLGKSMYYVSFIDDFSRKTWIYFFVNNSKVFSKFKGFKAFVENQTEKRIKVLRTDNGGEFWVEAVGTACYLVNRSPSSALGDKTPQEVWNGKEPSLTHIKVFGCEAYVHVPKENMSNLDKKAEKCIFIGYKYGLKDFNIWNPKAKKVVYRKDVVFREMKDVK